MGGNRSIQPLDALMVIREARYLSGNDLRKTVEVIDMYTYLKRRGELVEVAHFRTTVKICIKDVKSGRVWPLEVNRDMPVTIIGKDHRGTND